MNGKGNRQIGRRRVLQGLAALPFAGIARASTGDTPLEMREIAPGVFVHQAPYEEATPANRGDIANLGFIVGDQAAAVIDSGGSLREGKALLAAVRRVTDRPVAYVINTHFHPDHIFGNAAFPVARIVGHQRMAAALKDRGAYYRQTLDRDLGEVAAGSAVVPPDLAVTDSLGLDLGNRRLLLQAWPPAHTDCDMTVRDERTDSWFLGDLLFCRRMPTIDGSLRGWIARLEQLRAIPAARAVPGHGPATVAWPDATDPLLRYLTGLSDEVRTALKNGVSLAEATGTVGRDLKADWILFETVHPRNVAVAFAELEWE
ncbi:quinoprotein relay system zinc metallohydrolase 2 [Telmatospirillum siberiense]|uniref:MBL fold metallo-hydrolase n=1 Tax=Telmatospirillum siberiense TaxID=382514 RepID=A0A2N3PUR1_9PROT|nr:quinoprotein relay system zinc metallohydrolase 2 [Telmatospirillum siberiense]PKU24142.1 MBL fold metallo-hydrolase [Telmatospirillum siberiense]